MGLVTPLGNDVAVDLGRRSSPGESGVRTIEAFDPVAADRRGSPARSATSTRATSSTARTCGGPTATSSSGSSPPARRWTRPACPSASRASWPSGPGSSSAPASAASGTLDRRHLDERPARPGPDQPVPHPDGHPQRRRRPDRHQLRHDRARTSRPCRPARPAATPSARRARSIRRGDADMMLAGGTEAGIFEPLVGGFAAMRALSTRNDDPDGGLAAVRHGPRRVRHRRGRGRRSSSRSSSTPRRAARRSWPSSSATARPPTPRTSRCRRPAGSARSGPPGGRSRRPASTPTEIDHVNAHATSTPEGDKAELPGDPDDLRRPRAGGSRSRPTSRCSATRSARPARSRRSPRSWPSATAASRRRSTSTTRTRPARAST